VHKPIEPIRLDVRFFAVLREQAGCSVLAVDTFSCTPAALYAELQTKHPLTFPVALLRVSLNGRYAEMTTPLSAGDRVVFIPPVAGG
jgi:molybdopterin converting factor small subunit